MEVEFEEAVDDGKPLTFAFGCLIAAWREIGKHSEGRLFIANYALALGLIIPMAALQFQQAVGFLSSTDGLPFGMRGAGAGLNSYLIWSQSSATPIMLIMWLLLGVTHLCLAWLLVERDWIRVVKCGTLIGAAMITLSLFTGILMLDMSPLSVPIAELAIEFAAICTMFRWHGRVFQAPRANCLPSRS
ncbi:hypothetical protein ACT009_15070 [Sphingomonas sp. Tas61C01]|uniref:hypothetical protein n=1 Tax=Sphingomonas sp. Tas61C01 TaxID=3458297 RepID=UPI00403EF659